MAEKAVWQPDPEFVKTTRLFQWMTALGFSDYDDFLKASTDDIAWFWEEAEKALGISWYKRYSQTLNLGKGIKWPKWFSGGRLNAVYNAVEKWSRRPDTADRTALIWESEDGKTERITYSSLHQKVARVAAGFKKQGIAKGDVIAIYMPMIPETVIAMLAAAKIGAVFLPVFSGYGAHAAAARLSAAEAKILVTADGFLRRGKKVCMKKEADKAADRSPSVEKVVVCRLHDGDQTWNHKRDIDWNELMKSDPLENTEEMDSSDPLMLLYTSGTTGQPKGAVHTHAGFPLKAAFDAGFGMDVKQGDTFFWFTDMGWMMGPFLIFGGLINGAAVLLYDGAPDFPAPDRLWELVSRHRVTHLGVSPTLIRSLMQHGEDFLYQYDLSSLKAIGSTGEPWNYEPWMWLFRHAGKERIPIFNYSGGTEISGGILGNVLLRPITPMTFNSPLPGMAANVFNEKGEEAVNEVGELVLTKPWVGMTNGFWKEPSRYEKAYWSRWTDVWVHGDWAKRDENGYWTISGRSDDVINAAGKRIGPAEIESVLVGHPAVAEAGVIGVPDKLKGQAAVCFVVLRQSEKPSEGLKDDLLNLASDAIGKAIKPKAVYFVSGLPKTRNAKVMRRLIRAAYLNEPAGDLSTLENRETYDEIAGLSARKNL
ncbi:AMP-binding protein [Bacillus haynesii]|uniref:AMP-binding protein n=1 Tax=Bacillus haynesii TaxID=1925021 RepID=UPI002DB5A7A4|nr:AMP-binding protein [Bacillus haynesii]MEC1473404.1 AMP-binding protein [Bacillus haynesii]MEC1486777.1 AMP-binding protein [Bacillus haynesii]